MKKTNTLALEQLQARQVKCETENLDFITLKPLPLETTIWFLKHDDLKEQVKTVYNIIKL